MLQALGSVSNGLVGPAGLPAFWGTELVSPEKAVGERERVLDSSNSPSFLSDSVGGLSLPPKAPGRGAPRTSCPLVLPEQHDRERHPARAWRERPQGRLPAVQEPPGANGLPAAGLGRQPTEASPQNAPGALRLGIPVRQPQGH